MNKPLLRDSFSSASGLPLKIFSDKKLLDSLVLGRRVISRHLQLCPTSKCNLACGYCSCSGKVMDHELSLDQIDEIIGISCEVGIVGVTITGGGEPTVYPHINETINRFMSNGISVGLVSNGLCLDVIDCIEDLTWVRISFSDDRRWDDNFLQQIGHVPDSVDRAFSYVLTNNPNYSNLENIVRYVNLNKFTHLRIVSDIFHPSIEAIEKVKVELASRKINDDLVIYQSRDNYVFGRSPCMISILKPVIAPDGYVYPCCGVQYAMPDQQRVFPVAMRMGHYTELSAIVGDQKFFDGSHCTKCYYDNYNAVLSGLVVEPMHGEFI